MENNILKTDNELNKEFGKFIFNLTKQFYDNALLKNIKPNEKEVMVISSIILQNKNEYKLISFGTGTRSLPNKYYVNKDYQILDGHSEILTIKSFQFFILKCLIYNTIIYFGYTENNFDKLFLNDYQFKCFNDNKEFFNIFDFKNNKIRLKNDIHFHLYLSTTPCGDCSFNKNIIKNYGGKNINDCLKYTKGNSLCCFASVSLFGSSNTLCVLIPQTQVYLTPHITAMDVGIQEGLINMKIDCNYTAKYGTQEAFNPCGPPQPLSKEVCFEYSLKNSSCCFISSPDGHTACLWNDNGRRDETSTRAILDFNINIKGIKINKNQCQI